FYLDGKRYREYNGNKLGSNLNPNLYKTYKERLKYFNQLAFDFTKAIDNGWEVETLSITVPKVVIPLKQALTDILNEKLNSNLSTLYKRDLQSVYNALLSYFASKQLDKNTSELQDLDVEGFLNQYKSSGTYYMSKRKTTNVFFSELVRKKLLAENPIKNTRPMKKVAKLHEVYDKRQLKNALGYLEQHHPNLHLCCLLTYGCFLRPHQEIRLLKKKHIAADLNKIVLSASENKSRRVRTSVVPEYIKEQLKSRLDKMNSPECNLLSGSLHTYNESYLNTQWSRAKEKMVEKGLIEKGHTIYSFRHTAAVNVYRKTKDLHILQQLLGHSDMIVTLKYLRGLAAIKNDDLKAVMPTLNF
ncbi:MAG: site-specific integrase, partial [Pedobacter sp.]